MVYTGRTITLREFFSLTDCEEPGLVRQGPLMYQEPDKVYWYGKLFGATVTQAKILGLLIRFGVVPNTILMMRLPRPYSSSGAVRVHISKLRELLKFATNDRVRIETVFDEGYRLVVVEE